MSTFMEQLSLLFGGGPEATTPKNAAGTVERFGTHKPNWVPGNIPDNKAAVPFEEPKRTSARSVPPNVGSGPKYNTTPQNVGSGARVNTAGVPETTGKRVAVPGGKKPPVSMKPTFNPPNLKPALGGLALGVEALTYSESLNVDEFGGEGGKAWLEANRPEGWTSNTMTVEAALTSKEAIESQGNRDAVSLAEEKLNLLTESGASQSLINEATAELKDAQSSKPTDFLTSFDDETKSELADVQAEIDNFLTTRGQTGMFRSAELVKSELEQTGLPARKAKLTADLEDANLIREQRTADSIKDKAEGDPEADAVIKAAGKVDIGELTRQLQLKGIGEKDFKDLTDKTAKGWLDGIPLQEMMKGAAGFLGDLWDDEAIQHAFVYYMGARLMGYSGSGSGMAAGNVLLQGWANQDKKDLLTQTATAKAADKKAANEALDMSKTVTMWDPKAKQAVAGYMSKSGKFQAASGGNIVNAKDYGLESYDKSRHKTFDGIDLENIDYINGASKDVLANISNNSEIYSPEQQQTAQALFADGSAIQESYAIATRSARANGVDTSTPQYRTALGNSVRKYMMNTIKNPTDKFSGSITAGMADAIRADQLKADLTDEGGVPKFVFGKATWNADGIETMEEGYELPNAAVSKLMKQVDNINSGLVKVATEGKHSAEKIRTLITPTKTLQKLSKIFKDTVMKDPIARAHWTEVGDKANTNAMNAWLASSKSDTEHKYLGINNPAVNAKFHTLYNKKFKE